MARRARLDAELVRRKLARSREQAAQLVEAGRVQVRGTVARKVAAMVDPADPVLVTGDDPADDYVSRGGHKLAGALAAFGPRGLTISPRSPSGAVQAASAGRTRRSGMNDRSATVRSTTPPISSGVSVRTFVRSKTWTRSSVRIGQAS